MDSLSIIEDLRSYDDVLAGRVEFLSSAMRVPVDQFFRNAVNHYINHCLSLPETGTSIRDQMTRSRNIGDDLLQLNGEKVANHVRKSTS